MHRVLWGGGHRSWKGGEGKKYRRRGIPDLDFQPVQLVRQSVVKERGKRKRRKRDLGAEERQRKGKIAGPRSNVGEERNRKIAMSLIFPA